jgi:hypothetical protein
MEIDVQQRLANTQMRGRAYRKEFGHAFDDSEKK